MLIPASSRRRSLGRGHGEEWPSGPEPRVTRARWRSRRKRRCSARSRVRCPGWRGGWGDVLASPAAQPPAVLRGGGGTGARVAHGPGQAAAFGGCRRFLSGASPRSSPCVQRLTDQAATVWNSTYRRPGWGIATAATPSRWTAACLSAPPRRRKANRLGPTRQAGLGIPPAAAMPGEVLGHGRAVRSGTGPRQRQGPRQDRAGAAAGGWGCHAGG